jgi:alpha-L-fucosidase
MRYVVFTTKHHDGFCMFNTARTEYKITDPKVPFSSNARSNITREIFDAFRKDSFLIGAYFSKPDWHSEYFWWPYFPPKDHNVNYSTVKNPERWQKFCDLTYDEIGELMTGYGKVDILWLDGGWVRPPSRADDPYGMDIHMDRIAGMARKHQPGLIVVDRTVGGEFENYMTPEQEVPDKPLPYPWETCMTMGTSWGYSPGDKYKSVHELLTLLVKIVSRGGNFLLNVGPDATGDWDPVVYQRLKGIGDWMKINGEGIYASKPAAPYSVGNIYLTGAASQKAFYAFWLSDNEDITLPARISLPVGPGQVRKVELLGEKGKLRWRAVNGQLEVQVPPALQHSALKHIAVFKISD